jgi:hypothetical protein
MKKEHKEKVVRRYLITLYEEGKEPNWFMLERFLIKRGFRTRRDPKTGREHLMDYSWYKVYRAVKKKWEKELMRRQSVKAVIEAAIAHGDKQLAKKLLKKFSSYLLSTEEERFKRLIKHSEGFNLHVKEF